MDKNVNIKKLTKCWLKAEKEFIKICMKHLDCSECPLCTTVKGDVFCLIGSLGRAMSNLNEKPEWAQIELPEITVSEERGKKENGKRKAN